MDRYISKYEKLDMLARAFSFEDFEPLSEILMEECKYHSDYSRKHYTSSEQIIRRMKIVAQNIRADKSQDGSCTHKIIRLEEVLKEGVTLDDLKDGSLWDVFEYGFLHYQYNREKPAAVVFVKFNPGEKIEEINLSRNRKWFNCSFYEAQDIEDSEQDLPYTVQPMTPKEKFRNDYIDQVTYQEYETDEEESEVYIWKQADRYFSEVLRNDGYYVNERSIFDDCIGYQCNKDNTAYTIYMFASGEIEETPISGDYCAELIERDFSKGFVLVSFLRVERTFKQGKPLYSVGRYDNAELKVEFYHPYKINGKNCLLFFPAADLFDISEKLIYAFNNESLDAFLCITSTNNPIYKGYDERGMLLNDSFYSSMQRIHQQHGDMRIGYVTFNEIVYSDVPYIDDYGYFSFSVDEKRKVKQVQSYPFDHKDAYFLKANRQIDPDVFADIPSLIRVETFEREVSERFALKAFFDNGEIKKYVLPIAKGGEKLEALSYHGYVFSDGIWASATVTEHPKPLFNNFKNNVPGITFKNGYALSGMLVYEDGENYTEPILCRETVYEDKDILLEKLWTWKAKSIYENSEDDTLKVLLKGYAFNVGGISTIASKTGKRLCSVDLDYLDDSHEGMFRAGVSDRGYGYINQEGHFVIPPDYENGGDFYNGFAAVKEPEWKWILLNKKGEKIYINGNIQEVGIFSEGLCKVSLLNLDFMDLAYHSDYAEIAGTWGYINEEGKMVIEPQYIFAYDFADGMALVCKGKWTKDPKWDNKYNKGRYWTEEELWGSIDKQGNTVIPFIFDEIVEIGDDAGLYKAHYGGWKEGHWGVIDKTGAWLAEPIFENIDNEYYDGMILFYSDDKGSDIDVPLGIYDIKEQKVLFEPQFLDVTFLKDGYFGVEVIDEKTGKTITKVIDRKGQEKFPSDYNSIYFWSSDDIWEVVKEDKGERTRGLIDSSGKVILPCIYKSDFGRIYLKEKRIVINQDKKASLVDFDGNTIIPAIYDSIEGIRNPLYTVTLQSDHDQKHGLITHEGLEVLPVNYQRIAFLKDNYIICQDENGCTMLHLTQKQ